MTGVVSAVLVAAIFYVVLVTMREAWYGRLLSWRALRHPRRRRTSE